MWLTVNLFKAEFFVKIGQIRLIEQFDKRKEIVYTIFNKAVGR